MKANGGALMTDDSSATLDQAFARREAAFESATSASTTRPPGPAAGQGHEGAFANPDWQPGTTLLKTSAVGARANLAFVLPSTATLDGPPRPAAAAAPVWDELWCGTDGAGTPLERLVETMHNLVWLQRTIQSRTPLTAHATYDEVSAVLTTARQLCVDFDLQTARVRVGFALNALKAGRLDSLAEEISELVRHIRHDLQSCSIWPIAQRRLWAFSLSPGQRARRAFPSVAMDVAEGGRCAGFGFHNASVFHMLRAAAYGSRALETAAGGRRAASERASWMSTIGLVETKVGEVSRWPDGAGRTAATAFYTAVLNDAKMLHDAECRLASGESFDEYQTLAIADRVRDFLTRLADYVTESQGRPLARHDFAGPESYSSAMNG